MRVMNVAEMHETNAGFRFFTYGSCNACGFCSGAWGTLGALYVYNKIEKHCKSKKHFSGASFTESKWLW